MPQIPLRHSLYTYSNYSDNKLITRFCNQSATTLPRNPVFSDILSVFLLFKLGKFDVLDIVFHCFSIHICIKNMYILFLLFFVLIDCSTISGENRIHFPSLWMVSPAGNEFFDSFSLIWQSCRYYPRQ